MRPNEVWYKRSISYRDMKIKAETQYTREALLQCAEGKLFGPGNAQLPNPPMLMFDRITKISSDGGRHDQGEARAELDIHPDLWFFNCHFFEDPVMPGCLGLDALWQLGGFFLARLGCPGRGRALGCGEVKFSGQVKPENKKVIYQIDVVRTFQKKTKLIVADGQVICDGQTIYKVKNLKVGLFENI